MKPYIILLALFLAFPTYSLPNNKATYKLKKSITTLKKIYKEVKENPKKKKQAFQKTIKLVKNLVDTKFIGSFIFGKYWNTAKKKYKTKFKKLFSYLLIKKTLIKAIKKEIDTKKRYIIFKGEDCKKDTRFFIKGETCIVHTEIPGKKLNYLVDFYWLNRTAQESSFPYVWQRWLP
jgi:ABC-type transporter MlaC component